MQEMLLFSTTVSDLYKETSEAVNNNDLHNRMVIKKSLSGLLKSIFFPRGKPLWSYKFYRIMLLCTSDRIGKKEFYYIARESVLYFSKINHIDEPVLLTELAQFVRI